jgi:hypothetical protein
MSNRDKAIQFSYIETGKTGEGEKEFISTGRHYSKYSLLPE